MTAYSILRAVNPCLDPGLVVAAYCRLRGINRSEVLEGFSKVRAIVLLRHELMWLLRDLTDLSQADIGRLMGGRDQATIKAGVDGISNRIASEPVYRNQMSQVRAYVLAFTAADDLVREDAGAVIARRVLSAPEAQRPDVEALAITLIAIGAVLRSDELTDAEARLAALTLIRNAGGGRHV